MLPAGRTRCFGENTHGGRETAWVVLRIGLHETVFVGVCRGRRSRSQIQFAQNTAHVAIHGPPADAEGAGDGAVRLRGGDQSDDFQLRGVRQRVSVAGDEARSSFTHHVWCRVQPHEDAARNASKAARGSLAASSSVPLDWADTARMTGPAMPSAMAPSSSTAAREFEPAHFSHLLTDEAVAEFVKWGELALRAEIAGRKSRADSPPAHFTGASRSPSTGRFMRRSNAGHRGSE